MAKSKQKLLADSESSDDSDESDSNSSQSDEEKIHITANDSGEEGVDDLLTLKASVADEQLVEENKLTVSSDGLV